MQMGGFSGREKKRNRHGTQCDVTDVGQVESRKQHTGSLIFVAAIRIFSWQYVGSSSLTRD